MSFSFKIVLLSLLACSSSLAQKEPEQVVYEWKYLNFTWPSAEDYENALDNGTYLKKSNAISGIKVWGDRMFLSVPRLKDGVPATLLVTSVSPMNGDRSPNLEPYPNWAMQKEGDCSALQMVQSMEIDPSGRMWVLDAGRTNLFGKSHNHCPAKLVVLDLKQRGRLLLTYEFPERVANPKTNYLNDIVLDHEDGGFAYITNTDAEQPGIVVFSIEHKKSWLVTDKSMKATDVAFTVQYDNTSFSLPINVDGIAMSPASEEGRRRVFYCPLSSLELFSVPTDALKSNRSIAGDVRKVGTKPSQADGMVMSADARLYFGQLQENAVSLATRPYAQLDHRVFRDDRRMQWPDSFAIDQLGQLWVTSSRLQVLAQNDMDTSQVNFRVIKLGQLRSNNYQYYGDGSAPLLPRITG